MYKTTAIVLTVAAVGQFALAQDSPVVGKLTQARNTQISRGLAANSSAYVDAKVGQPVHEGYGIRTFRRSSAEITFNDSSVIRVNQDTDLVVESAATLRRIRLERGAMWVRDQNGSRTSVQTPVDTATARGTIFTVSADGVVAVTEGEVELSAHGATLVLEAGEVGGVGPGGAPEKLGSGGSPDKGNMGSKDQGLPVPTLITGGITAGFLGTTIAGGSSVRGKPEPVPEPTGFMALATGASALLLCLRSRKR